MLVLTRKLGEKIQIGENIVLKVVAISGSKIRLGIEAPEEVRIVREELVKTDLPKMHLPQTISAVTKPCSL